jgi:hypothetical protein
MRKASTGAARKESNQPQRREDRLDKQHWPAKKLTRKWQLARRRKKKLGLRVRISTTTTDKDPATSKSGARKTATRHDPDSNMYGQTSFPCRLRRN